MVILTLNKWSITPVTLLSRRAPHKQQIATGQRSKMKSHADQLSMAPPTHLAFSKAHTCDCSCILKCSSAHTADGHTYAEQHWHTHVPLLFVVLHTHNSGIQLQKTLTNTQYNTQAACQWKYEVRSQYTVSSSWSVHLIGWLATDM